MLRVDPSMIPKIFQVLYDSEGQILLNNSTTTMSNSMIQPQVRRRAAPFLTCTNVLLLRIKIDTVEKQSNTKAIVSSLLLIVCPLNAKLVIVRVTMSSPRLHVSNALAVMFVAINNITTIEKNSCNPAEVGRSAEGKEFTSTFVSRF